MNFTNLLITSGSLCYLSEFFGIIKIENSYKLYYKKTSKINDEILFYS